MSAISSAFLSWDFWDYVFLIAAVIVTALVIKFGIKLVRGIGKVLLFLVGVIVFAALCIFIFSLIRGNW
jgi:uncharacterized membrane protein